MGSSRSKPRLLVTGASGVLGWSLCRVTAESWETYGIVHDHLLTLPNVAVRRTDLTDYSAVRDTFADIQPEAVIHAAALSDTNCCQEHPDQSEKINVAASVNLAEMCADFDIPCVFTSSDLIFDGEHPPYREDSPAKPVSVYGEHKLRAEIAMRERHPGTTVCRLPLMFGYGGQYAGGSFVRLVQALRRGDTVPLFVDEIRTPVSTLDASLGLMLALRLPPGSTLHLGGPESISRWSFGLLAAEIFVSGDCNIVACRQADLPMSAPRPRDVSLDSSKSLALGFSPKSLREEMVRLRASYLL